MQKPQKQAWQKCVKVECEFGLARQGHSSPLLQKKKNNKNNLFSLPFNLSLISFATTACPTVLAIGVSSSRTSPLMQLRRTHGMNCFASAKS